MQLDFDVVEVVPKVTQRTWSAWLSPLLSLILPYAQGRLPRLQRLGVAGLAFLADAKQEGFGRFQFVRIGGSPVGGEFALEGGFQQRLAVEP